MAWVTACTVAELDDGEAVVVERQPAPPVAVFNVAGDFFAIDDTCTHEEYSLADGYIDGDIVECPLHMAKFSIRTGQALTPPATVGLCPYVIKVEDGVVFVDL